MRPRSIQPRNATNESGRSGDTRRKALGSTPTPTESAPTADDTYDNDTGFPVGTFKERRQ